MHRILAIVVALLVAAPASAVPIMQWSGTTSTSEPMSLPAPGESPPEWDLSAESIACTGILTVAARAESGAVATWMIAVSVSGQNYAMPALVRLLYPPQSQLAPMFSDYDASDWRVWFELSSGAYGAAYAVHLKVWAPGGDVVHWSASLDGACSHD